MIALHRCGTPGCDGGPWPLAEFDQYDSHTNYCDVNVLEAKEEVKEAKKVLEEAKKVMEEASSNLRLRKVKIVIT